jgi:phage terminase large subunit GpA-like protein
VKQAQGPFMTNPERVTKWLKGHPNEAFCDDCIATSLNLPRRQQAHQITSALANTSDFLRYRAACSECGEEKLVIGVQ